ncbi:MAG: hypothetical protein B5M51_02855, partial [Anaerolinea sp. 4484_236]
FAVESKIKEKSFFFVNLRVTSWILKCTNNILSNYVLTFRALVRGALFAPLRIKKARSRGLFSIF